ncbi:hypothetical protein ACLB2K_056144 [Fragaria x ananassa]
MVDAAARGWRDNSGVFGKTTVEERILPVLNSKLGCHKTYNNYQSRLKWFKSRWLSYSTLMRFSSGFGYDYTTKRFTAPDEVWDEYLKAHPKDANLRYGVTLDYEDLEIAVGNGVVVGKNSIGLGSATDARTLGDDEGRDARIENLDYDVENEVFVAPTQNDPSFRSTSPLRFPKVSEDCIGVIDGTHIPAMIKGRDVSSYHNRHGSAHDSKLLNDALSKRNGLEVPQGKYFLVDCGFANRRQFLTPLRGVRYHLKDFGGEGRHSKNAKANAWRTSIANAMWARRPRNDDDEDEEDNNEDQADDIMNNEYMVGENQEIYDVNEVEMEE